MEEIRDETHFEKLMEIFAPKVGREKILELIASSKKIKAMGFWKGKNGRYPDFPHPVDFVDPDWNNEERQLVIAYLNRASINTVQMGLSWCRFECEHVGMGGFEYTDGTYCWPEGLSHYIEKHDVRLPDEFVQHVFRNLDSRFPEDAEENTVLLSFFAPDFIWWKSQEGWKKY
ncbi:MAG TPA: hypothetical protein VFI33_09385 [Puia sp.]|nr:hypothetical protein [Puia sp.]